MAAFEYKALDQQRQTGGVIQADTARAARQQLRDRGLVPLEIEPVARRSGRGGGLRLARERALILRQLSALLRAGLPLEEVLALIVDQDASSRASRPLASIRARVLEGQSLSSAMAEHPALFPGMVSRSVAAGEQAGQLESVIESLAEHAEKRLTLARGLTVALVYPLLLAAISLAVVWGLLGFVVPRVVGVFEHSGHELPWLTTSLIGLSDLLSRYGLWIALGGAAVLFAAWLYFRNPGPRLWLDRGLLGLPLVGRLVRTNSAALFARTFAILVSSSVPAVEALRAVAEVMPNRKVRLDLEAAARRVREGASISAALHDMEWLPPLTRRLIAGGEQAGDLGAMLEHAARLQESDLEDIGQVALAVIQPLLIVLVGAVVLYIVLAILLPIMNLSQLLGSP